jgi:hypothetical protein
VINLRNYPIIQGPLDSSEAFQVILTFPEMFIISKLYQFRFIAVGYLTPALLALVFLSLLSLAKFAHLIAGLTIQVFISLIIAGSISSQDFLILSKVFVFPHSKSSPNLTYLDRDSQVFIAQQLYASPSFKYVLSSLSGIWNVFSRSSISLP